MAEHARRHAELDALGVGAAALSVDGPDASRALADRLALPFPLLCDTAREVVRAYGCFNAKENGGIAYPATFVVDRDRTVRFRSLDRTASRVDLDALFAFVRSGVDSRAPAKPPRCAVRPTLRDWACAIGSAIRYGAKSRSR